MVLLLLFLILALALNSALAAADRFNYVIYPKDGTNQDQVREITADLEALVHPTYTYISASRYLGTFYWLKPFGLSAKPETLEFKSKIQQKITEMDPVHKTSMGVNLNDKILKGYYYDSTAGQETTVYVIDSGLEQSHSEFAGLAIDWLWAGPTTEKGIRRDASLRGHGSCMVAQVAGKLSGIAKKAKIKVVKSGDMSWSGGVEACIDALAKTYDDIKENQSKNRVSKAVVSMSWTYEYTKEHGIAPWRNPAIAAMIELIHELIKLNVVCVTSAGNGKTGIPISGYPAALGATLPSLIIVGGVSNQGVQSLQAKIAPYVKISASAIDYSCPNIDSTNQNQYHLENGTSGAAAAIAGLAAYFLTLGTPALEIQKQLYSLAYSRVEGGPKVAYNGVDFRTTAGNSAATER